MHEIVFLDGREFREKLAECFKEANTTRIAVAYLAKDGYKEISQQLEDFLEKKNHLTIIVGISNYHITEWQALDSLVKLKKRFQTLEVKYYNNEGFHPKLFVFKGDNEQQVIVGSSNLTGAALKRNVEANILATWKQSDTFFHKVDVFWKSILKKADDLDETVVSKYRESFRRSSNARKGIKIGLRKTPLPDDFSDTFKKTKEKPNVTYWKIAPRQSS